MVSSFLSLMAPVTALFPAVLGPSMLLHISMPPLACSAEGTVDLCLAARQLLQSDFGGAWRRLHEPRWARLRRPHTWLKSEAVWASKRGLGPRRQQWPAEQGVGGVPEHGTDHPETDWRVAGAGQAPKREMVCMADCRMLLSFCEMTVSHHLHPLQTLGVQDCISFLSIRDCVHIQPPPTAISVWRWWEGGGGHPWPCSSRPSGPNSGGQAPIPRAGPAEATVGSRHAMTGRGKDRGRHGCAVHH